MKNLLYLLAILSIYLCSILPAIADAKTERTSRIKAAFILNIARYAEWKDNSILNIEKNYQLCFLEKNPLGTAIKTIENKRIGKKRLNIQNIPNLEHNNGCHILFLTQNQIFEILTDMGNQSTQEKQKRYNLLFDKNVLTLGDQTEKTRSTKNFSGVIINLIRHQNTRIGIEINISTLKKSKIKLSSELMKLGKQN